MDTVAEAPASGYDEFWNGIEFAARAAGLWPPPWSPDVIPVNINRRRGLYMDELTHRAYVDGDEIWLTPIEFRMLICFYKRRGLVVSCDEIGPAAFKSEQYDVHTITVHLSRIRRKLGRGETISTVRGVGYRLE